MKRVDLPTLREGLTRLRGLHEDASRRWGDLRFGQQVLEEAVLSGQREAMPRLSEISVLCKRAEQEAYALRAAVSELERREASAMLDEADAAD
jgi:hypothetical protein